MERAAEAGMTVGSRVTWPTTPRCLCWTVSLISSRPLWCKTSLLLMKSFHWKMRMRRWFRVWDACKFTHSVFVNFHVSKSYNKVGVIQLENSDGWSRLFQYQSKARMQLSVSDQYLSPFHDNTDFLLINTAATPHLFQTKFGGTRLRLDWWFCVARAKTYAHSCNYFELTQHMTIPHVTGRQMVRRSFIVSIPCIARWKKNSRIC